MKDDSIQEIRGVEKDQNIDEYIQPVLDEKLKEFGDEGRLYLKKSKDMKRMTTLTEKHKNGEKFLSNDLRFLYEIDDKIEGFGYGKDPRINTVQIGRDWKKDMNLIFDVNNDKDLVNTMIDEKKETLVLENIKKFKDLDRKEIVNQLINKGQGRAIAENFKQFEISNEEDRKYFANNIIELSEYSADSVAYNFKQFEISNEEDRKYFANNIMKSGKNGAAAVAENFKQFEISNEEDRKYFANNIIELSEYSADSVAYNFKQFEISNEEDRKNIANNIIELGEFAARAVAENFKEFNISNEEDRKDIANNIIESDYGYEFAENLEEFLKS